MTGLHNLQGRLSRLALLSGLFFAAVTAANAQAIFSTDFGGTGLVADNSASNINEIFVGNFTEYSGDTFTISFDVTYNSTEGLALQAGDFTSVWFNSAAGQSVGIKGTSFFTRPSFNKEKWLSGLTVQDGETYFVTATYSKSADGGDNYDTFSLWVETSSGSTYSLLNVYDNSSSMSSISQVAIRTFDLEDSDSFTYNNLAIVGAAVVPEPSTWALGIGLVAIAGFIYRRRK